MLKTALNLEKKKQRRCIVVYGAGVKLHCKD